MFVHTDIIGARWNVVDADDKRRARLNCISHLLRSIPYHEVDVPDLTLPARQSGEGYVRPPITDQTFVPDLYVKMEEE